MCHIKGEIIKDEHYQNFTNDIWGQTYHNKGNLTNEKHIKRKK
jgi:hypothetical protein